jgi:hypothetical protein
MNQCSTGEPFHEWKDDHLVLRRLSKRPLVVTPPDVASEKFIRLAGSSVFRQLTRIACHSSKVENDTLIYFYESMQCDYFLFSVTLIEKFTDDRYKHMVHKSLVDIPRHIQKSPEKILDETAAIYLGYPLQLLLRGSAHDKMREYLALEKKAEVIRKKFSVL